MILEGEQQIAELCRAFGVSRKSAFKVGTKRLVETPPRSMKFSNLFRFRNGVFP